jgi:hypothetical protein
VSSGASAFASPTIVDGLNSEPWQAGLSSKGSMNLAEADLPLLGQANTRDRYIMA